MSVGIKKQIKNIPFVLFLKTLLLFFIVQTSIIDIHILMYIAIIVRLISLLLKLCRDVLFCESIKKSLYLRPILIFIKKKLNHVLLCLLVLYLL